MKLLIYSICLVMLSSAFLFSQETKSCCTAGNNKEAKVSFASFGDDESFRESHQLPAEFILLNPQGKMIKIPTVSETGANAYYIESATKTDKFIIVIHEWWGLNDNIKREADELKDKLGNVNILALDLYDGKLATKREDAAQLMQSADAERIRQIFDAAVKFAGINAKFGTIGWCFGGGWSLQMSLWLGDKAKACVMYYGIIENDKDTFNKLNAPVLGIFAKQDSWVNPEVYGKLEKNIKAADKKNYIKKNMMLIMLLQIQVINISMKNLQMMRKLTLLISSKKI